MILKPLSEAPETAGVYLLYREGRLVYIGQSNDMWSRIDQARRGGFVDRCYCLSFEDREHRTAVEEALIAALDPPGNHRGALTPKTVGVYPAETVTVRISSETHAALAAASARLPMPSRPWWICWCVDTLAT